MQINPVEKPRCVQSGLLLSNHSLTVSFRKIQICSLSSGQKAAAAVKIRNVYNVHASDILRLGEHRWAEEISQFFWECCAPLLTGR